MEGPSQDDGALITEQIIEELRQEREREEMEEREWDSKDLNANFVDLLLTIEEDVPSGELFSFLFDLLEEYSELAPHEAESRTGKGQELDFFSVFFQLLPRCGTSLQVVLLKRLNDLVSESDRVKGYCCQRGWVTRLLHMLHYQPLDSEVVLRELFILMESLGSFSLSSKELKQLLRFLYGQTTPDFEDSGAASDDSPEGKQLLQELYPPVQVPGQVWCSLVDTLQRIVKKQERRWPSCFWDFNGRENKSGVMIPTWKSVWPLNDGYSFCAWLSISSNKDVLPLNRGRRSLPPEQATIRPHLFSFACDDGRGMELFFVSQYLVVLSRQGKNKHAWIKFNYRFKKERWYFVAVAHIYHFLRRSEVLLYVNGQLVEQQYLIYPKIDAPVSMWMANHIEHTEVGERSHPFCGQMGKVFFFSEAITATDVQALHALGPNFLPKKKSDTSIEIGHKGNVFSIGNKRYVKIFFAYDPKAMEGNVCVETSTRAADRMASALQGVAVINSSNLKDSLYCLGGIKTFLPLFLLVRQPLAVQDDDAATDDSEEIKFFEDEDEQEKEQKRGDDGASASSGAALPSAPPSPAGLLISLISNLLQNYADLFSDMPSVGGWQIFGFLLQKMHPTALDVQALNSLDTLATVLYDSDKSHFREFFTYTYLNFSMWSQTASSVQEKLLSQITTRVKAAPQYFRKVIGVQRIVDALCDLDFAQNRIALLQLIGLMAVDGLTFQETKNLLESLHRSQPLKRVDQGADVLKFIIAMLNKFSTSTSPTVQNVASHIFECGGLIPFLSVLQRPDEHQRIWALKIVARMLQIATPAQKQKMLSFATTTIYTHKRESSGSVKKDVDQSHGSDNFEGYSRLSAIIKYYLQNFNFSKATYYALMEILLERVSPKSINVNPVHSPADESVRDMKKQRQEVQFQHQFRNPQILPAIFELLGASYNSSLQQKALEDFYLLLSKEKQNRDLFLQQDNWPHWLLAVIAENPSIIPEHAGSPASSSSSVPKRPKQKPRSRGSVINHRLYSSIFSLIVNIVTLLFHHAIYLQQGWKVIERFQGILQHFQEIGPFPGHQLVRQVNSALLQKLTSDPKLRRILQTQSQLHHNINSPHVMNLKNNSSSTATAATASYQIASPPPSPSGSAKIRAEWLWENVVKWICFAEEGLFQLPPPDDIFSPPPKKDASPRASPRTRERPPTPALIAEAQGTQQPGTPRDHPPVASETPRARVAPRAKSASNAFDLMARASDEPASKESKEKERERVVDLLEAQGAKASRERDDQAEAREREQARERDRERNRANLDRVSSHFLLPIYHSTMEERGVGSDPYLSATHNPPPSAKTLRRKKDTTAASTTTTTTMITTKLMRRPPSLERRPSAPHAEAMKSEARRGKEVADRERLAGTTPADAPPPPQQKENLKWVDFHFAQRLLDLIDDLLLLPVSVPSVPFVAEVPATAQPPPPPTTSFFSSLNFASSAPPAPQPAAQPPYLSASTVRRMEEQLSRLALRLTLYTLDETDVVLNTQKIRLRSEQLKDIKKMVETYCHASASSSLTGAIASIGAGNEWGIIKETVHASEEDESSLLSKRLTLTLGAYVEGKFKQWDVELKDVNQTFSKSIKRLSMVIHQLLKRCKPGNAIATSALRKATATPSLARGDSFRADSPTEDKGGEDSVDRVLYALSFLYKAMQRSYESGGMGTELMADLFKEILLKLQRVEIIQVDVPPLNFPHPTDAHEHQKFMRKYEEEYLSRYVMFLFSTPLSSNSSSSSSSPLSSPNLSPATARLSRVTPVALQSPFTPVSSTPPPILTPPPPYIPPTFPTGLRSQLLINRIEKAIRATMQEEIRYGVGVSNRFEAYKRYVRIGIEQRVKSEQAALMAFQDHQEAMLNHCLMREQERKKKQISIQEKVQNEVFHYWGRLQRTVSPLLWNNEKMLRDILHEDEVALQGLDVSPISPLPIQWKLDKREGPFRIRKILRRNFNVADYGDCARDSAAGSRQSQQPADEVNASSSSAAAAEAAAKQEPSGIKLRRYVQLEKEWSMKGGKVVHRDATSAMVTPLILTKGILQFTSSHLYFIPTAAYDQKPMSASAAAPALTPTGSAVPSIFPASPPLAPPGQARLRWTNELLEKRKKRYEWPLSELVGMYGRRYLLRDCAMELFFADNTSYLFKFESKSKRDAMFSKLRSLSVTPPALKQQQALNKPKEGKLLERGGLTRSWVNREISNFDYLMRLNALAGRTYNDLGQYPVFPWIFKDYTSSTLNLDDASIYRDLSKPVGALDPQRLQNFKDRYRFFEDPVIPKFLYGSHYSSASVVLYFLVRLEPFTSYFLSMQGGKFDHPDRMFHSLPRTWANCLTNPSDVKELIPELFYMPELIRDVNGVNFGNKADDTPLRDVQLPPWAEDSPERFIALHREALESDYVSVHLHEWIDLIFGYKQRGPASVEANNVFFHLTYEGAVDLDAVKDPVERSSIEEQIKNFGQTPSQLFTKPHPQRRKRAEVDASPRETKEAEVSGSGDVGRGKASNFYSIQTKCSSPIIFITPCSSNNVALMHSDGLFSWNYFNPTQRSKKGNLSLPFTWHRDSTVGTSREKRSNYYNLFPSYTNILSNYFAIMGDGKILLASSGWELAGSFNCILLQGQRILRNIFYHKDVVTSIALASDDDTFVTGSLDTMVFVWSLKEILSPALPAPPPVVPTPDSIIPPSAPPPTIAPAATAPTFLSSLPLPDFIVNTASSASSSSTPSVDSSSLNAPAGPDDEDFDLFERFESLKTSGTATEFVASGGTETEANGQDEQTALFRPRCMLRGHDDGVTCVAISTEYGIVVSGGKDGKVIIHQLRKGRLLQAFGLKGKSVHLVAIAPLSGHVVSHSAFPSYISVHSVNGVLLSEIQTEAPLGAMAVIPPYSSPLYLASVGLRGGGRASGGGEGEGEEEWLVSGEGKKVFLRRLPSLRVVQRFECLATVTSLHFVPPNFILAGAEDGQLSIFLATTAS